MGRPESHAIRRSDPAAGPIRPPVPTLQDDGTLPARSREQASRLLAEWTPSEALRRHGPAVEAAVAWYGEHRFRIVGPELETWRAAGLLHGFDYERYPETYPLRGAEELRKLGYPDEVVEAVLGHGDHTGVPRISLLARTVYACDEMTGFVIAVAYVRPN